MAAMEVVMVELEWEEGMTLSPTRRRCLLVEIPGCRQMHLCSERERRSLSMVQIVSGRTD